MSSEKFMISIVMASYNNAEFLEKSLEGCFFQKTCYPYVVIIADDNSQDDSVKIIKKWQKKHSNIILSSQKRNCIEKNYTDMFNLVKTKYIAFCDGDDFWTDENKLQMQVQFLEENTDFRVSTHKVDVLIQGHPIDPVYAICKRNASDRSKENGIFYPDEIADNYYFHTSSFVFRWLFPEGLPQWWQPFMTNDHFLLLLHAAESKVKYFDRTMSVWRRHDRGYTWLQTHKASTYIRERWLEYIELQIKMEEFFKPRFTHELNQRIYFSLEQFINECIATDDVPMLQHIVNKHHAYLSAITWKYEKLINAFRRYRFPTKELCGESLQYSAETEALLADNEEAPAPKVIGGGTPIDIEMIPPVENSIWDAWTQNRESATYINASSALRAVLWNLGINRFVWLPQLFNPMYFNAIKAMEYKKKFYPVNNQCHILPEFIDQLEPDDIVLTTAYFGAGMPTAIRKLLASRKDIIWIEDRSHALYTGEPFEADYVLYSAPDVAGVPDGGILVGNGALAMAATLKPQDDTYLQEQVAESVFNYEHPGRVPDLKQYLFSEDKAQRLSRETMSRFSKALLKRIPLHTTSAICRRNWKILYGHLHRFALWNTAEPEFAPLAFPIFLAPGRDSARLASFLSDENIVCPRLYASYVGQRHDNALTRRLFSLPCGHQYSEEDMQVLAEAVLRLEKTIWP